MCYILADVKQDKTVISTTIAVGDTPDAAVNVIPTTETKPRNVFATSVTGSNYASKDMEKTLRSDMSKSMYSGSTPTQDIPLGSRSGEEGERVRPRSMSPLSPLSTSPPVSSSMLQEVRLRSRPSVKKTANENLPKEVTQNNELAKALDKAKRRSRKFDENIVVDVDKPAKSEVKPVDKSKDLKLDSEVKVVEKLSEVKPQSEVSKPIETIHKPNETILNDKSAVSNQPLVSPTSPGVSFVLKKEPLRPASKVNVTTVTSFGQNVETSSIVTTSTKESDTRSENKTVNVQDSDKNKDTKSIAKDLQSESPVNKLASPREEYRQKRQVRSKTLPVSKEAMEKAEEKVQSSSNRNSADLDNISILRSTAKAAEIETSRNISVADKRSSWAPSSATTNVDTRPPWVIRAQNKEKKIEEDKTIKPKEIKIELSKNVKNTAKSPDTSPTEKPTDTSVTTQLGGKPSIKAEKPVIGSPKPSVDTSAFAISAARSQFVKSAPTSTPTPSKPTVTSSDQKPAVNTATKPMVGSISKLSSNFGKDSLPDTHKPVAAAYKKPAVSSTPSTGPSDKSNIQSAKPYVNKSPEKQVIQSVKPPAIASVSKFGNTPKSVETGVTRPGLQKQPSTETNKPAPLGVRSAGINNKANVVTKPETKDPPQIQTNTVNKTPTTQGNNENAQQTGISSASTKSGSLYGQYGKGSNTSSGDTGRKFGPTAGSNTKKTPEMKIEIIDRDKPVHTRDKPVHTKNEQVSACFVYSYVSVVQRKCFHVCSY